MKIPDAFNLFVGEDLSPTAWVGSLVKYMMKPEFVKAASDDLKLLAFAGAFGIEKGVITPGTCRIETTEPPADEEKKQCRG